MSELLIARARRWQALVPHDNLSGIVFDTVRSASIAHLPLRDAATGRWVEMWDAATLGRPVNAAAVAQSMAIPHTTIRRRAAGLVAAGQLVRVTRGFLLAPGFLAESPLRRAIGENAKDMTRTIADLADAGYIPAIRAHAADMAALPPGVVERPLLAFSLRALETFTQRYGDVTGGTLVSAIIAANIRHITGDPALARRYASEAGVPPDSERRPVSLRVLSRLTGIPFETVRRRVARLVADGFVVRGEKGVTVPSSTLTGARHAADNRRILAFFEHMLDSFIIAAETANQAGCK